MVEPAVYKKSGRIRVSVTVTSEPSLEEIKQTHHKLTSKYMQGIIASQRLGISSHLLSRITGTIYVQPVSSEINQDDLKYNIGLNLKFNKKNEEVSTASAIKHS